MGPGVGSVILKVTKLGFQVAAHAGASAAAPLVQETVQEMVQETVQGMERNWLSVRAGAGKWGCFGLLRFHRDDIFFAFSFVVSIKNRNFVPEFVNTTNLAPEPQLAEATDTNIIKQLKLQTL